MINRRLINSFVIGTLASAIANVKNSKAQILGSGNVATETTQIWGWIKQQADTLRQLEQMRQQFLVAKGMFDSVVGARDVYGLVNALGSPVRRYMPEAGEAVGMIQQGSNFFRGASNIRSADQLFRSMPNLPRFADTNERWQGEMERREMVTANIKAMAAAGMEDIDERIAALGFMQARVAAASDMKDVGDVANTIKVSEMNLNMQQSKIAQMQVMLLAANRSDETRREQMEAEGANKWANSTADAVNMLQGD